MTIVCSRPCLLQLARFCCRSRCAKSALLVDQTAHCSATVSAQAVSLLQREVAAMDEGECGDVIVLPLYASLPPEQQVCLAVLPRMVLHALPCMLCQCGWVLVVAQPPAGCALVKMATNVAHSNVACQHSRASSRGLGCIELNRYM